MLITYSVWWRPLQCPVWWNPTRTRQSEIIFRYWHLFKYLNISPVYCAKWLVIWKLSHLIKVWSTECGYWVPRTCRMCIVNMYLKICKYTGFYYIKWHNIWKLCSAAPLLQWRHLAEYMVICLSGVVLLPSNIYGHIRTGIDLRQCALMTNL